ncbi:MAG: glutamate synthase domain-containing protein 3, partial [Saprospiraceae bacterium]
ANDYFGKGLSGGKLILVPDRNAILKPEENSIVGNVALYGATSGEVYISGIAGERFGVRNSGVTAVVEGIGDNGCEYMTGGKVLILGQIGNNFAAGMSGGEAYLFNPKPTALAKINKETILLEMPSEEDLSGVRELLRTYFRHTSSARALLILTNWEQMKNHFVKVMPVEYKRVLAARKLESAALKLPPNPHLGELSSLKN